MNGVLIDTSVWIAYFRGDPSVAPLNLLIDRNLVQTNDLILCELVPSLELRKEHRLVTLLVALNSQPMAIDWIQIRALQLNCLSSGANGIGIPDLIIAQHAVQNSQSIFSLDKHFRLIAKIMRLGLYPKV